MSRYPYRALALAFVTVSILGLSSCRLGDAVTSGAMLGATQAQSDGLMRVTATPPSIGHRRLEAYCLSNKALRLFVQAKGRPTYLVEESRPFSSQLVLFYPEKGIAYLVKFMPGAETVTVAGPAKIGDRDKRLFAALKEVQNAAEAYKQ